MTWPISANGEFSARLVLAMGHFLWEGAAIAAAAFPIASLAARSARARYAIYLCALTMMAASPIVTFFLLGGRQAVVAAPHEHLAATSVITSDPRPPSSAPEALARTAASPQPALPPGVDPPAPMPAASWPHGIPQVGASVAPGAAAADAPAFWRQYAPRLAAAYFAGVLAMLGRLLLAIAGARRLRRLATPLPDGQLMSSIAALCRRLGVPRPPVVSLCARAGVPVVVGILRPMILLPASVVTGLTPEQLRAILAHELAHLRRLDPWANLFQQLVEAILFFHPAVWIVSRRLRAERELCCDDLAAGATGESRQYAESLVRTAELCRIERCGRFSLPAAVLTAIDRPSRLRRRVVRLLQGEAGPRPSAAAWPIVLLVTTGLIAVAVMRHHPAAAAGDAKSDDGRVAKAIDVLSSQGVFDDPTYAWVASLRDLEQAGRPAVPAICRQLRTSDRGFYQCSASIALRAIGDRRAVPALIAALERCRVHASDCAFSIPDPELAAYYSSRQLESRMNGLSGTVGLGRPVREITGALERLTGHSEGESHLRMYQDDREQPTDKPISPEADEDERERMLIRTVASRWRVWWAANRTTLLNPDELKWVDEFARSPATSAAPATSPLTGLQLRVVMESGGPAAGAAIEVWADSNHVLLRADAGGRAALSLPQAKNTSIIVRQAGSVPTRIWFGPDEQLPDHYDLKLHKGTTVGGTLRSTKDKPAAGARVFPVAAPRLATHEWANLYDLVATSGADGRWVINGVPAGFRGVFRVEGSAAPADAPIVVDDETRGMQTPAEELAARKVVWKLKPLYEVKGLVVDSAGRPVAGAQVLLGGWLEPVHSAADGRFSIRRVGEGKESLTVQADDYGSVQLEVQVTADMAEQTITLPPPRPLMGHIVDQSGSPVVGAIVRNSFYGMWRLFDFETYTGAAGEFSWAGVPQRDVNLAVYKEGYDVGHAHVKAGQTDVTVPLRGVLRTSGTVVDAQSHQPIPSFSVLEGRYWGNPPHMSTLRALSTHFTAGSYELKFYKSEMEQREDRRYLRVEADGYKPAFSRPVEPHDGAVTIDFALERGDPIAGKVVQADGSPAAGAEVAISTPSMDADMYRGKVRRNTPENILFVESDPGGGFALPPQVEPYEIVVSHDSGWAQASREQFEKQPLLKLAPWGRIEGEIRQGGKPAAKAQVTLSNYSYRYREEHPEQPYVELYTDAQTDAAGHYAFPRVYPGHYRLSGQYRQQGAMGLSGPGVPIDVVAGQTLQISFGTDGQHEVTGKIAIDVPPGGAQPDPATLQVDLSEAKFDEPGAKLDPSLPRIHVPIAADGSFHIDAVKSGLWRLTTQLDVPADPHDADPRGFTSRSEWQFEVPGGTGGPPIPLGELRLSMRQKSLTAGQFAPPFQVKTLDGKPLNLRDLRGKYVLLDFWATWCGPCIGETPNLKAVHDAFKDDPRFVMVSLSLDFDPGKLRAYVDDNQLTWPQALLEGNWDNPVVRSYGVGGIPTILLIGPDGKIIAPNLRGAAIKAAVAEAMGK